ncbi:GLPGLI family protein [Flavobacteriaceae bacterium]|nr:GLPGLI family protein [Flavobacteriaceae bacterium]
MKQLTTLLFLLFTVVTFSQKKFEGKATYMSKRTMDMSRFDKMSEQQKKQMKARFKNFLEKTYTLSFNKSESSFKENVTLDAPGTSGPSWGRSNGQGSIYKNLKDKEMVEDVEQFSKRFRIVEEMEFPQWEMSGETKQIGQYLCYKATMVKVDNSIDWGGIFNRRGGNAKKNDSTKVNQTKKPVKTQMITAWYTPQIPVSAGPEGYWGLPGLILEINAGRTTMLCTEIIINPEDVVEIKKPSKGKEVSREEYDTMMKVKSEELRERFQNRRGGGRRF